MSEDAPLWVMPVRRLVPGRVRRGLDADIKAALDHGFSLQDAGIAALRTLADQIDALERQLRAPDARPYDRIPLTGLVGQFDATYTRVFAVLAQESDPIARALAEFMERETSEASARREPPAPHQREMPRPTD